MKVREIRPDIFMVRLPLPIRPTIINAYLIRCGREWTLIDTGVNTTDNIETFMEALEELRCKPERVRMILCTHHHPDHFGASKTLKERTGAEVRIHRAEYERAQTFAPKRSPEHNEFFLRHGFPLQQLEPVPSMHDFWASLYAVAEPDAYLDDGDVVRVGDKEFEVVWTPGHAPGHCVMYLRRERVMFAGDHLLPKITPHVGWFPGAENPLKDFLDSLRKVQRIGVDLVLPAHGGAFTDHRHRAKQIIQHHEVRLREMADFVRKRPYTAYDIAAHVFGFDVNSPLVVQFPATFETLAHLEYLRHAGKVVQEEIDGQVLYGKKA